MLMRLLIACAVSGLLFAPPAQAQFEPSPNSNGKFFGSAEGGQFQTTEPVFALDKKGDKAYTISPKAPQNPASGPKEVFVYKNSRGTWKLPANLTTPMDGSAKYTWFDGSKNEDKLTYIAFGKVTDNGGYFIPKGDKVPVWAVMSSDDNGNTIFFYFGTDSFQTPQGRRYPMYWSWESPIDNPTIRRLISDTGTERL